MDFRKISHIHSISLSNPEQAECAQSDKWEMEFYESNIITIFHVCV